MSEPGFKPDAVVLGFGPLSEREISVAAGSDRSGQETWYAAMLDRYHEMYALERKIRSKNRGIGGGDEHAGMNAGRDRLHKQLERLGNSLGKSKDAVLADVMAREGNLGEYELPEFGVLVPDQIGEREYGFGGIDYGDIRRGRFVHASTSKSALDQKRAGGSWREEAGMPEGSREISPVEATVAGLSEKQAFASGLLPGEAAVIFGNTFTVEIQQHPVEITPPGYPERVRRAIRASKALRERGVDARAFMHTIGTYHDTVTVVGVAVPVEKIPVETVGLLRGDRSLYGVRLEDMDARLVEEEYRAELAEPDGRIEAFHVIQAFYELGAPKRILDQVTSSLDGESLTWLPETLGEALKLRFPEIKPAMIDEVAERAVGTRVFEEKERHELLLREHARFFGKR